MSKTIKLTTAQAIIKFLNSQYIEIDGIEEPFVEGIFAVFGHGNVLGLGQALQENPGHLKMYQGKNEQGMAHAATGFARQKLRQKIFAVTASAGPGSANMITAAGTAFANNIPLLIFPADTFATRQPDPVLQQLENEFSPTISTNDAFKAVSKFWDRINRPEQLMSSLIKGFQILTDPSKTGPVTICLPQDVEGMSYDYPIDFFKKRIHHVKRQVPDSYEIEAAVELIRSSKKPVLVVGGGAKYSLASNEVKEFSLKYNIPIVETHSGKSTVECDFVNNLGGMGILGTSAANKAVNESDLIIGLGTKYTDFTTSSKTIFNEKARFININLNSAHASRFDAVSIIADVKMALTFLIEKINNYTSQFDNLEELKYEWEQERERLSKVEFNKNQFDPEIKNQFTQENLVEYSESLGTEMTQTEALITLNNQISSDSIAVAAAGSLPGDLHRLWETEVFNTYHLEYGYSCMGYEIGASLGAKLASPEQEVYALVGDGSFLMLHSELLTSLQYDKKINVILFDNSGFGCINNLQMGNGGESFGTEFRNTENEVMNIDYQKIAEGYGAKAYKVNNKDDLITAIEDSKKQKESTLIEIKVLPKTMTDGYDFSWWHVGLSEVSSNKKIEENFAEQERILKGAKKY